MFFLQYLIPFVLTYIHCGWKPNALILGLYIKEDFVAQLNMWAIVLNNRMTGELKIVKKSVMA
jgi:hypothetical protein